MPKKTLLSFDLFEDRFSHVEHSDDDSGRILLLRAVKQAVREELTARQTQCVVMRYSDGKNVKEIAAESGVCPSTVCKHLKKARARLKKVMKYYSGKLR